MTITINNILFPVTSLGYGRRVGVWLQGCSIGCDGCMSVDTWDPNGGTRLAVDNLIGRIAPHLLAGADGVTISGGEPLQQSESLVEFTARLSEMRHAKGLTFDILGYSGYTATRIKREFASAIAGFDALIAGPFVQSKPSTATWWGSANQDLMLLSALGKERYGAGSPHKQELQLSVADGQLYITGVPRVGDLARMEEALRKVGIEFEVVSWR